MSRNKLILATHNLHKQKEMNSILSPLGIVTVGLDEFPHIGDIEETGTTLIENAYIKARTVYELTGIPSLADDTGLEVDSLGGSPGVYSARYAGKNPTYQDNCNKLLLDLKGYPKKKRVASFRTVIAFVDAEMEHHAEGIVKGRVIEKYKGDDGFGYDPIFQPESQNITYAEMEPEKKNKISHRFKALDKIKEFLVRYYKDKGEYIDLK
ncbi:RdgB/HAM1 family non-canonical purine NTP pyrophosphatase [Candidatus Marinimicrobia bacterium]|nr:RdgB/HAM1 family non-canonical purine NTP pyrophosphatase [Candidatus Neomarinimicrobiota bacterium]